MEKELQELTLNELENLKFKFEAIQFEIRSFEEEKAILGEELEILRIKADTLRLKTIQSLIHKVNILESVDEILAMLERVIKFKADEARQKLVTALDPIDTIKR